MWKIGFCDMDKEGGSYYLKNICKELAFTSVHSREVDRILRLGGPKNFFRGEAFSP